MNDLSKKLIESGIIDESVVKMLAHQGVLDDGAVDLVKRQRLKDATREELVRFAEEIGEEVEKRRKLRETMLDLNQIRWPTGVDIFEADGAQGVARGVVCVIDRMGRFYFRPQDVKKVWFRPGYRMRRIENHGAEMETILEVSELFVGDQVAAIQVSTK